jgi:hypothetical protein
MALLPYGTLGQGQLQPEAAFKQREQENLGRQGMPNSVERRVSRTMESLAIAKNTTLTGIALAYVMHKAPYVFPIVGGRRVEHIKSNVEALKIDLSKEDITKIEESYRFDPGFSHTFLSGTVFGDELDEPKVLEGPQDAHCGSPKLWVRLIGYRAKLLLTLPRGRAWSEAIE